MAQPRVEVGIEQVDHEIDDDQKDGNDEDGTLDYGIVAAEDALDDQLAEARKHEDLLDDDGASERDIDQEDDDRDHRDHHIGQGMLRDGPPFGHTLRSEEHTSELQSLMRI